MKKTYIFPKVVNIDLSAEGNLLSLSLNGGETGGPGVEETGGGIDQGEELTQRQNSLWDTWTD